MTISLAARCLIPLTLTLVAGKASCEPPTTEKAAAALVRDQSAAPEPEARNAAIKYLVAMLQNSRDLDEKISQVDFDACGVTHESQAGNPAFVAGAKALDDHDLRPWIDASLLSKCDFEWPREQGFNLLLPHLGKMRSEARVLRFAARRELGENRPLEAVERLATIVRMANHVANDEIVISSLVSMAMTQLTLTEMRVLAQSGRMTEATRAAMIASIESLGVTDPCGVRRSIQGERSMMLHSTMAYFTGPDAGRKFSEFISASSDGDEATKVRALAVADWNQERLASEAARAEAAFEGFEAAWDAPDAAAAIAELERRISSDEFGIVAAVLCPSLAKVHASSARLAEDLASTLSLIKAAKATDRAPAADPATSPAAR